AAGGGCGGAYQERGLGQIAAADIDINELFVELPASRPPAALLIPYSGFDRIPVYVVPRADHGDRLLPV
ncbi:MAG: hypothetical protein ACREVJ_02250, partial [Gammaproteobacteria bacterium]